MIHWLSQAISTYLLHPLHSNGYQLWSGSGSDLGELTLIGLFIGAWRHVNCHAPWCLRLGKHPTSDGHFKLCRKHHPDLPDKKPSLAEIQQRHRLAKHGRHNDPENGVTTSHGTW